MVARGGLCKPVAHCLEEGLLLLHNRCDKPFLFSLCEGLLGLLSATCSPPWGPREGSRWLKGALEPVHSQPHCWDGGLDGFNLLQDPSLQAACGEKLHSSLPKCNR